MRQADSLHHTQYSPAKIDKIRRLMKRKQTWTPTQKAKGMYHTVPYSREVGLHCSVGFCA